MSIVQTLSPHSRTWTFYEGEWREGNTAIMGPRTHGAWLCSTVFDGARRFEGVAPDLDLHCERVNRSASIMRLQPCVSVEEWLRLSAEGMARFAPDTDLYIRPMYWAESGLGGGVKHDPASTRWCLCLYEAPMPPPRGVSITLSPYRRPTADCAPVEAKAGCLYPNGGRALAEAADRGFDNAVMCDALGNVAELANANIVIVKDGVAHTPVPNGTFLDGITRRRVLALLRQDGTTVVERTMRWREFLEADEIFSCGNFAKVAPVSRIEDRLLPIGRVASRARELYWAFAHGDG